MGAGYTFAPISADGVRCLRPGAFALAASGGSDRLGYSSPLEALAQSQYPTNRSRAGNAFENGWLAVVEGGWARIERKASDFSYESRGVFLRAGLDFNLWQANKSGAGGFWSLGFKYGWAGFGQSLDYRLPPGYWLGETGRIENKGLQAHWLVLQSRLQAQVFRGFFLGPLVRLHLLILAPERAETELNSIPGFGLRRGGRIEIGYQLVYALWQKSRKDEK
ncbi:MAG: hypothetical protein HC913_06970 [Microscillaceae bacterium]|nr:hypothetical protein [Microscillaceae bacterium]